MGPEAQAAVSALVKLLEDEHKPVRTQAIRALEKIDPETASRHVTLWSRVRGWLG
jgi:HEAT repeat protein